MANNLGSVVDKFTTRLDQKITAGTCTSDLNLNQDLLGEYDGNGKIEIATIAMDGLGDYDRSTGFPTGSATLSWQAYTMKYDRGRAFEVDAMDDEERELILSANLMNTFMEEKVIPEVDAIRFAKLAANAGTTKSESLTDAATALKAVQTAEEVMQDYGKELSECLFYHTAKVKTLLRQASPYQFAAGTDPNTNFTTFDEMKMINVEQARFYSAIDLYDGKTDNSGSEGANEIPGGYVKSASGKNINFIVMHPSAVAALQKHEKLRYFAPDTNQSKDAHLWQYRLYHDLLVFLQKKGLIYVSVSTS